MSTRTITINTCDRCGSEHDMGKYTKGNEWGQLTLSWTGDKGARTWSGDAAGANLQGRAWLCMGCTNAFLAFMEGVPR